MPRKQTDSTAETHPHHHQQQHRLTEADLSTSDKDRFQLELEFLQCLANPNYLSWLSQNKYFEDRSFLSYLSYLSYWSQPQYAAYIIYPHSLYFLDMLQKKEFREMIGSNSQYKDVVNAQQFFHWQHGNKKGSNSNNKADGGGK